MSALEPKAIKQGGGSPVLHKLLQVSRPLPGLAQPELTGAGAAGLPLARNLSVTAWTLMLRGTSESKLRQHSLLSILSQDPLEIEVQTVTDRFDRGQPGSPVELACPRCAPPFLLA